MVRDDLRMKLRMRSRDRVVVSLIWLFGLMPVIFPAAVLAGVTVAGGSDVFRGKTTLIAALGPSNVQLVGALPVAAAVPKIQLRVTPSVAMGDPAIEAQLGQAEQFVPGLAPATLTRRFTLAKPKSVDASAPSGGWVMKHFPTVKIYSGLKLGYGGLVVRLAGVRSLPSGATCRRLDGFVESCSRRAKSRLEVLVEGRPVNCQIFRGIDSNGARARCKAGDIDLAADLLRNKLAQRG